MEKGIKIVERAIVISLILLSSALIVFGAGMVAADESPSLPGVPTGLTAVAGYEQVSLTWTAPVSDGGDIIDYYVIYQENVMLYRFDDVFTADPLYPKIETVWQVGVELPDDQSVFTVVI